MEDHEINPFESPREVGIEVEESVERKLPYGVWRDGKTLVMLREGALLPRACLRTNATAFVSKTQLTELPPWWTLLFLALIWIPFIGLFLTGLTTEILIRWDHGVRVNARIRTDHVLLAYVSGVVVLITGTAGNILIGASLLSGDFSFFYLGPLGLLLCSLTFLIDKAIWRKIKCELDPRAMVRITGVHSNYLNRLPEYPLGGPHQF